MHSPPVAGGGQCGDGLKLRWQRALNDVKGRQDGRIALQVERQETEGARCATDVLQRSVPQRASFSQQSAGVFGVGERIEPIMKRQQTSMHAQNRNQLLVDIVQALCLSTDHVELPKDNGIRS